MKTHTEIKCTGEITEDIHVIKTLNSVHFRHFKRVVSGMCGITTTADRPTDV